MSLRSTPHYTPLHNNQPLYPASLRLHSLSLAEVADKASRPAKTILVFRSALDLPLCKDCRGETEKFMMGRLSVGMLLLAQSVLSC